MENKKVTTPAGKELILKPFLTARDRNTLRSVFMQDAKIDPKTGAQTGDIEAKRIEEAEPVMLRLAVISYDGKTDPAIILEALLNGSPVEYDFVIAQASAVNSSPLA